MASAARTGSTRKRSKRNEDIPEDLGLQASGFKFSRQSRYRKVTQKKGNVTKSARKKRRSSFAQGRKERRSLVFSSLGKAEIYKEIPTDLPPETRLRKLFEACLKGAVEKLDNSSEYNVDGIPNFTEEAKEVFSHLQALITDSDIMDEAFKPLNNELKQIPNPKNNELEEKVASCLAVTERWKAENEKWDKLLSFHQEQVARKEKELQEEDSKRADQCPDFLSPEQHQLLSGKPSMKGLTERLGDTKNKTLLQVEAVAQTINIAKEYEEAARGFIDKQVKTFAKTTFEATNQAGTPRTVIPRLLKKR